MLWPSDHANEIAYRPTIEYLSAATPSGAATIRGITRLTPMAGGSPLQTAQGQASRRLLLEWTLAWPSLHSMVTREPPNETFLGTCKTGASSLVPIDKAWRPTPGFGDPPHASGSEEMVNSPRAKKPSDLAELSERARKLLKGKNFAFVATVNKDGTPQLTPTWVDTDGENVLINTALGRQKNKNVTRDPRVTVGVFDMSNPYDYISVSGKVVKKVTGKPADDHIDKMAMKYTGAAKYTMRQPNEKRVILTIRPSKSV